MANSSAKFFVHYTGNGVVNLGKAGTFQAGTKAWVDETIAEMARGHADFMVSGPGMDSVIDEMPMPVPAPLPMPEPAAVAPAAAAPAPVLPAKPQRRTRMSGSIKIPDLSDIEKK